MTAKAIGVLFVLALVGGVCLAQTRTEMMLAGTQTLNPASCVMSPSPRWCSGSDMGAWINAAYGALPASGGEIDVPAGSWSYTTPILAVTNHKTVRLHGAGVNATTLRYTATTGTAIAVDTGNSQYPSEVDGLLLVGPGIGTSTTGLACGSAANNGSIMGIFDKVQVTAFGIGVNLSWNCFAFTIANSDISNNNQDLLDTFAQENMKLLNDIIALDTPGTTGSVTNCTEIAAASDWHIYGTSFDNCQLAMSSNTSVFVHGAHFENPSLGSYDFFVSSGNTFHCFGCTFNQDNTSSFANNRFGSASVGNVGFWGGNAFSPVTLRSFVNLTGTASAQNHGLVLNSNFTSGWVTNRGSGYTAGFDQDGGGNTVTTGVVQAGSLRGGVLQQIAARNFAGSCSMSSATSCSFTTTAEFTNYVSFVSIDQASAPPATAISAKCAINGTTVTITAGASNSLTWDCLLVGNPN